MEGASDSESAAPDSVDGGDSASTQSEGQASGANPGADEAGGGGGNGDPDGNGDLADADEGSHLSAGGDRLLEAMMSLGEFDDVDMSAFFPETAAVLPPHVPVAAGETAHPVRSCVREVPFFFFFFEILECARMRLIELGA